IIKLLLPHHCHKFISFHICMGAVVDPLYDCLSCVIDSGSGCAQSPATFLMKTFISSLEMVPLPSLSNSLKHASKSASENSPFSPISESVFFTNAFVSFLSR